MGHMARKTAVQMSGHIFAPMAYQAAVRRSPEAVSTATTSSRAGMTLTTPSSEGWVRTVIGMHEETADITSISVGMAPVTGLILSVAN